MALLVGPAWLTLATMPMPWYARLTLFVPALALPLAAVALSALRPHVATIGGLALVGLAAVSLVHANVRPNINIRAAFAALLAAMRGRDATWPVTGASSPVSRAVEAAPGTFQGHGVVCEGGRLWQLAGGS